MTEATKEVQPEVKQENAEQAKQKTITVDREIALLTLSATNASIEQLDQMEKAFLAEERTERNKACIAVISSEIIRKIHIQGAVGVLASEGKLDDFVKGLGGIFNQTEKQESKTEETVA